MTPLTFVKMEGCRNDYVFVDAGLGPRPNRLPETAPFAQWARDISDRHTGVGGDGLIVLWPGTGTGVRMRMWNADGSEGRLCLNGLRCAAKFAAEDGGRGERFVVETVSGDRPVRVFRDSGGAVSEVEVAVGRPDFRRETLPASGSGEEVWGERFRVGTQDLAGYAVSVGNPHLVFPLESPDALAALSLETLEPWSRHPRFPEGINVHAAAVPDSRRLIMRTWERGTGPTLACGSGAVAVFAAARRWGRVDGEATVSMPGGDVRLREGDDGALVLCGPARECFRGTWTAA